MRKLLIAAVFALALLMHPIERAKADHVLVDKPISAFLFCNSVELSYGSLKRITNGKPFKEYAAWLGTLKGACIDSRSVGIKGFVFMPEQKLKGETYQTDKGDFQLWWGKVGDKSWFTWAGHKVTPA